MRPETLTADVASAPALRTFRRLPIAQTVRLLLTAASLGYIAMQLGRIDREALIGALPHAPLFYACAVLAYVTPPLFEWRIYHRLLQIPRADLRTLYRKRALNEAVLDYSGELALYVRWRDRRGAGAAIKAVNVLSGVVSNSATILLLLAIASQAGGMRAYGEQFSSLAVTACALTIVLLSAVGLFRRRLIALRPADQAYVVGQHATRLALGFALQLAQWSSALPHVPISAWLMPLAAWMVATRIPFVPNRDLLLTSIGLAMAGALNTAPEAVSAMFLAAGVLPLLGHVAVLLITAPDPEARP